LEDEPTEQWHLGQIEIQKISKGFTYLVTARTTKSPKQTKSILLDKMARLIVKSSDSPRPLSKVAQQWARRIEKRKATKMYCQAKNEVIDNAIKQALLESAATSNFIQSADGFEVTGPSSKIVSAANGAIMKATMTALLPLKQLKAGSHKPIVVPDIQQALMSVK
jgi:hypothetical protein